MRKKELKRIELHYTDGTILAVPEDKQRTVGTLFMKAVGKEGLDWRIIKGTQPTLLERVEKFFQV